MSWIHRCLAACGLLLAVTIATASADVFTLQAVLDGLQMVPPNASPGFGSLEATLDDSSGLFTVTSGNFNGLVGTSTQVFLNSGTTGANGPFIMTLTLDTPGVATGTFSGGGVLTVGEIVNMLASDTYVRIGSTAFPGGEIRGQLQVVPEPGSMVLSGIAACGAIAFGWRHRRAKANR